MQAATSATAWRPEEHCLLTVLIGTVSTKHGGKSLLIALTRQESWNDEKFGDKSTKF